MACDYAPLSRWLAEPNHHKNAVDLICNGGHKGLNRAWEELGKGKRFAGVTPQRRWLSRIKVRKDYLEKSQVCPAGEEAEVGQPQSSARQYRREREQGDDADVDEGDFRDSERDDSSEERYRMRRDELTEGNEESDLEGNGAANNRKSPVRIPGQGKEEDHGKKG